MRNSNLHYNDKNLWEFESVICLYRKLHQLPPSLSSTLPMHVEKSLKEVSCTQRNFETRFDRETCHNTEITPNLPVMLSPVLPDRYGGLSSLLVPLLSPSLPPRLESKVASYNLSVRSDRLETKTKGKKSAQNVTASRSSNPRTSLGRVLTICPKHYKPTCKDKREPIVPQRQRSSPISVLRCTIRINYIKLAQYCQHRSYLELQKSAPESLDGVLSGLDALLLFTRAYSNDIAIKNWQNTLNYAQSLQRKTDDQLINGVLLLLQSSILRYVNKLLVLNKEYKSFGEQYITNDIKAEDLFRKAIKLVPNYRLSQITRGNFLILAPLELNNVQKLLIRVWELKTKNKRLSWCAVE